MSQKAHQCSRQGKTIL